MNIKKSLKQILLIGIIFATTYCSNNDYKKELELKILNRNDNKTTFVSLNDNSTTIIRNEINDSIEEITNEYDFGKEGFVSEIITYNKNNLEIIELNGFSREYDTINELIYDTRFSLENINKISFEENFRKQLYLLDSLEMEYLKKEYLKFEQKELEQKQNKLNNNELFNSLNEGLIKETLK